MHATGGVVARPRPVSPTEQRNPRTLDIDTVPTLELLERLNDEDALVAPAVRRALPALATVVDEAVRRVRGGGRVHYVGCGTSGRLAVLDAAELLPTFGLPPGVVVAHLAGGDRPSSRRWRAPKTTGPPGGPPPPSRGPRPGLGLSASGTAPYVGGALAQAQRSGAFTALITSNPAARWPAAARSACAPAPAPKPSPAPPGSRPAPRRRCC